MTSASGNAQLAGYWSSCPLLRRYSITGTNTPPWRHRQRLLTLHSFGTSHSLPIPLFACDFALDAKRAGVRLGFPARLVVPNRHQPREPYLIADVHDFLNVIQEELAGSGG